MIAFLYQRSLIAGVERRAAARAALCAVAPRFTSPSRRACAWTWRWPPAAIPKQARCRTGRADSRELASRTGASARRAEGITRSRRLGPPVGARSATRSDAGRAARLSRHFRLAPRERHAVAR